MPSDDLANQAAEQLKIYEKQKAETERKLDASKHQQSSTLEDKLKARLKKKEEKEKLNKEKAETDKLIATGVVKVDAPLGNVAFAYVTIKNVASLWETLNEETALKALEDIHELVTKDLRSLNIYNVKDEIGKFLLASQNVEDLINLAMKLQIAFNENQWSSEIMKQPSCKKLLKPEDSKNPDAKPLFSGPRVQIGIYSGEASAKKESNGQTSYSGITVMKVEAVGNFAQGGQILLPSSIWDKVDKSKLVGHEVTFPGTFKLDGFSAGCKVVEVLPTCLKERAKFFGSVCAHCNEVIKPNEQFFRALNCIWHMNHFQCFECNSDLGGSYVEDAGSPYCKTCYLAKNAPKCKNCNNPITSGYINALGGYWHPDCFSCRRCLKKPSSDVQIYEHEGEPYCGDCFQQMS